MKKIIFLLLCSIGIFGCTSETHKVAKVHCYRSHTHVADGMDAYLYYYILVSGSGNNYYYYSSATPYTGNFSSLTWSSSSTSPINFNSPEIESLPDIEVLADFLPAEIEENVNAEDQIIEEPTTETESESEGSSESGDSGGDSGGGDGGGSGD